MDHLLFWIVGIIVLASISETLRQRFAPLRNERQISSREMWRRLKWLPPALTIAVLVLWAMLQRLP